MARTFEFVLYFVGCVTVTVSPNQIIIIIIIIIIPRHCTKGEYETKSGIEKTKNNE